MPRVGARYVFFLTGNDYEQGFQVLTGYELTAGTIVPLDSLHKAQTYKDANETTFLKELRTKAASY